MFENTQFTFNGVHSSVHNCFIGNLGNSSDKASYSIGGISITEESFDGQDKPFFYGKHLSPMTIKFSIFSENEWTYEKRFAVSSWLLEESYKPLISDDKSTVVYNCICLDSPQKIMIGNIMRGIELTFRCDSPYPYLPEVVSTYIVTTPQIITIDTRVSNYKKKYKDFEIEFTLSGSNTGISIKNTTDANRDLTFTGLNTLETIYINNRRKEILSSTTLERGSKSNFNWLRLLPNAINSITITGACSITFRYKLPILI